MTRGCPGLWLPFAIIGLGMLAACGGPPATSVQQERATTQVTRSIETTETPEKAAQLTQDLENQISRDSDLILWLTDPDPTVRQDAIDAIVESATTAHIALLRDALKDPHAGVREAAAEALEELEEL